METISSFENIDNIELNKIVCSNPDTIELTNSKVIFKGENNHLIIDDNVKLNNSTIEFAANNSIIVIKQPKNDKTAVKLRIYNDSLLFIGNNCSFNGLFNAIISEARNVIFQQDCMFSSGVWLRTCDVHLIYDSATKKRVNFAKNIVIGSHVWIGQDVRILKGAHIGSGSVVGAGSIVTSKLYSNSVYAGNPSKLIKENIFWTRPSTHAYTKEKTQESVKHSGSRKNIVFNGETNLNEFNNLMLRLENTLNVEERLEIINEITNLKPLVIHSDIKEVELKKKKAYRKGYHVLKRMFRK